MIEIGKRKRVCILENDRGRGRDPGIRVRTLVDGDRERNEARQDVRGTIIVEELSCLSSSSSSSAFPLRLNGRTSAKPERKGAKEGEARTISNVNTYLIVAFPSKPRSFLPRDDSRDRSQEREGEGERETKGRKDGKGKIGGGRGREKENERERESVIQGYTKYISAAKNFETIELLLLSPPSFSSLPWYANRRRFTYSENRKSSDHASSLPVYPYSSSTRSWTSYRRYHRNNVTTIACLVDRSQDAWVFRVTSINYACT